VPTFDFPFDSLFDVTVETEEAGGQIDHVVAGLNRLCQQFKTKQNIVDLLTIFLTRYNDLETAFWALLTQRGVYSAIGKQLDNIGKLVGQPRNGLSDEDYRRYIFARIATDKSDGVIEDLITITALVINDAAALIQVDDQGEAAVVLRVLNIVVGNQIANILIDFLRDAVSAGVRLILETQYVADSDTWCFAVSAFAAGALSMGDTHINVDSTAGFPTSGSLDLDAGLGVAETVTYSGVTLTSFIGVSALANNHVDTSEVALHGSPGKGMGDTSDATVGGEMISARDGRYP
jgi:hypothetical protein